MSSFKLTRPDYIKILNYYSLPVPSNVAQMKKDVEAVLAKKLCSCIKKVSPNNEPKAIGICTKTIFNRKGLTRGKFTCTNKTKSSKSFRKVAFIKAVKNLNITRKRY
jgi:hypothetical protein